MNPPRLRLYQATDYLPPPPFESPGETAMRRKETQEYYERVKLGSTTGAAPSFKYSRAIFRNMLLFVVLFFLFMLAYSYFLQTASLVAVDLDPGFELRLTSKDLVRSVVPVGEGDALLQGAEAVNGTGLTDSIDGLVALLLEQGYDAEGGVWVLVSVSGRDLDRTRMLREVTSDHIARALLDQAPAVTILRQTLGGEKGLAKRAGALGVTRGRLQLVELLVEQGAAEPQEVLLAAPVEQLVRMAMELHLPLDLVRYK